MKVTVCELRNDPESLEQDWRALCEHVKQHQSELVLLPEMPFFRWLAASADVVPEQWNEAVRAHEAFLKRLPELGATTVVLTLPVVESGERFNEAVIIDTRTGKSKPAHRKRYLPDEDCFWEASWYSRGDGAFDIAEAAGSRLGFAICTELWFLEHARSYCRQGAHFLLSPRATMISSADKWVAGGRAAAVVSGAFSLSSNFSGDGNGGQWAGAGWIIEPEEGDVLGVTSRDNPFLTLDVDLAIAETAKSTYPRYVLD